MRFAAIQGYTLLKRRLTCMVKKQQVPHAQLFWGPEGNASLPLAWAFTTYLNCQNRLEEDACGSCASCLKMKKLIHPDVSAVFPTSATKQITGRDVVSSNFMKAWRTFLQENPYGQANDWSYYLNSESKQLSISKEEARSIIQTLSLKTFEGGYKVVLIWLPEYLHVAAANTLLKIIEEPPSHTLFLLVSNHPDKILGTIRSRTQHIYIPAFSDKALANTLTQKYSLRQEQIAQITLLANGNLNKARRLVDSMTGDYFEHFKSWMRSCYAHNFTQLVAQAASFHELSRTGQRDFLAYSLHMIREALVLPFTQKKLTRASDEEQRFAEKLRQTLTYQQIKTWITWLDQAFFYIERHTNPKILYLNLSLKIARTFKVS
ncbi:MAG: DNA polymerase III subunit [Bacteroidota bacterium]